jgi:hypothetical protein
MRRSRERAPQQTKPPRRFERGGFAVAAPFVRRVGHGTRGRGCRKRYGLLVTMFGRGLLII